MMTRGEYEVLKIEQAIKIVCENGIDYPEACKKFEDEFRYLRVNGNRIFFKSALEKHTYYNKKLNRVWQRLGYKFK